MSAVVPASALRVVAVDGTPLIRVGLRAVIEQAAGLRWLGATGSPHALRNGLPALRPHVVIVDASVDPRGELVRDLVGRSPALTVVALLHDHQRTATCLRTARVAGAHGLVRREAPPADLVTAIMSAHSTRWFVDPGLGRAAEPAPDAGPLLTRRQREILELIASGMSETAIAATLVLSQATVRTHIKQLRRRLGARDRAHAVARAYSLGVMAAPEIAGPLEPV